jgi:hypothetical protein
MTPKNTDPFQPWNDPMHSDNPFAAHNGVDSDDPSKPWNEEFGDAEDLDDDERASYGLSPADDQNNDNNNF